MEGFFERLKQRKIVQWALAYVAAAFALIQVLDIVAQRFGWPDWTERFAIIALVVGLFVTLVLAWYHGERGAQRVTGTELSILALLLAIGGGLIWRFAPVATAPVEKMTASSHVGDAKSIAVLPFENLSDDKSNAYFASGIQDEILTKLAGIADLKVISRTSTEKYASHPDNLKIVAAELGVGSLLEGSLQKAGDRVRVNVQLINALTDTHLWAKTYDKEMHDVFAVESEVSEDIANALKAKLSPGEVSALANWPTENADAYDELLQGDYSFHKGDDSVADADYRTAEAHYRKAIALDPNFALADARLAYSILARHWFVKAVSAAELDEAKAIIDRALAIDPNLPEAHLAFGFFRYWGHRDYAGGTAEFERTLALQPSNAMAMLGLGAIHRRQGNWTGAVDVFDKATKLAPRYALLLSEYGQTLAVVRRYSDAKRALRDALAIDPSALQARSALGLVELFGYGDAAKANQIFADLAPELAVPTLNVGGDVIYVVNVRFYPPTFDRRFDDALNGWDPVPANSDEQKITRLSGRVAIQTIAGHREAARSDCEALRALLEPEIARAPEAPGLYANLAWAFLCLGRNDEAVQSARRATEVMPETRDAYSGNYYTVGLAQVDAWVGQPDEALKLIEHLLSIPAGDAMSVQRLKLDPVWDPLRKDPRFQALIERHAADDENATRE